MIKNKHNILGPFSLMDTQGSDKPGKPSKPGKTG